MTRRERLFDGPERAVRFTHNLHRHDRRGHPFFGAVLILLGALFLLDNLDVLNARYFIRTFWPVLLILWGGYNLVAGGNSSSRVFGVLAMAFGGILLGNLLFPGWRIDVWDLFWPLLLIFFGVSVLFNSRRIGARVTEAVPPPIPEGDVIAGETVSTPPDDRVDSSATFKELAILSGIERRNISQTLRGGEVTAVLGGVELDLSECRMGSGEAFIDVFVLMGGVELRIPREWTVESRVTALLAGVEDRSVAPVTPGAPRLIIRGTVLMGGVEIKN